MFHNGSKPYDELADEQVVYSPLASLFFIFQIYNEVCTKGVRLKCISDKFPNKLWKVRNRSPAP